jgi:hypothetical protein
MVASYSFHTRFASGLVAEREPVSVAASVSCQLSERQGFRLVPAPACCRVHREITHSDAQ